MSKASALRRTLVLFAIGAGVLGAAASRAAAPASAPASAAAASGAATAPVTAAAPAAAASASSRPACPTNADYSSVDVTGVSLVRRAAAASAADGAAEVPLVRLRQEISLAVSNLPVLLERERCSPQHKKIVLYLDGRPLTDRAPYPPANPASQTLNFVLERKETSRDVWTHILGKPVFDPKPVPVSVGIEDEYAVPSSANLSLEVIPVGWFALWSAIFVALVVAAWKLAVQSNLLKDPAPNGAGRRPYSLARMQIAFWFFIILASYLFIGIITGDYGTSITGTVLGLMGISAGTAIGSSVIDGPAPAPAPPAPAPVPAPPAPPGTPRFHWWLDILSDDNGVNFHRFQMAAWTFVLGIIFIQQVYSSLAMPTFDNTLLALLGISSGTYLSLKSTSEAK